MTRSEAKRLKLTTTLADAHALADRALANVRAKHARAAERSPRATGATKADRRKARDDVWERAKDEARPRALEVSNEHLGPRCEFEVFGKRCDKAGTDPDHIFGGSLREETERHGGACLMWLCREHHDQKTANSPSRSFWLDIAEVHILRHGFKVMRPYLARARALLSGRSPQTGGTP